MKRKGFTLIELLAVIVILAIIAVIATPIITNIIEDSKKAAFNRSVEGIIKGLDLDVAFILEDGGYTYTMTDGVITELEDSNISISNTKGFTGEIKYDSASNVNYAIYNDKWCVIKVGNDINTTDYVEGECVIPNPYANGSVVYYDVLNGTTCTNYHIDNSKTGYNGTTDKKTTDNQNSCLKFYAFNDDVGDTTVNLLLDHNTTAQVYWTESGNQSNASGPIEVINHLKTDTNSWVGTITPTNYTVSQTTGGNYTIDYSDYKARLITANEIAEITGNTTFNESTTTISGYFYFDTNTSSQSDTCKNGNTTGCSYGWLYDRTSTSCTGYGCSNNSDAETYGYWTSTSASSSSYDAWRVYYIGTLSNDIVNFSYDGVRPVITLYKSNL